MAPEAESGQKDSRMRKMVLGKPRKKSPRLSEAFHLSLIVCLPQLILKSYFAERLFSASWIMVTSLQIPIKTGIPLCSKRF